MLPEGGPNPTLELEYLAAGDELAFCDRNIADGTVVSTGSTKHAWEGTKHVWEYQACMGEYQACMGEPSVHKCAWQGTKWLATPPPPPPNRPLQGSD